ncbi:MAG: ATP synthase F1 subunit delta [Bacteroidales bacterium]|jgi:F-type H+-transporting ATPase subunit delta|nr:ATP synthase F1 subunit delta [Bacteroidales bacterium]
MIRAKQVDIRYATALQQTAIEQGLEQEIYHDMIELRALLLDQADFRLFLKNSAIKPSQKSQILNTLFKDSVHQLTLDFMQLILKKSRISNVQGIILAYIELHRKVHRLRTVTVYTANELSPSHKDELQAVLTEKLPTKTVELRTEVRPQIIGGLVLRFDDYLFDNSLSARLGKLRRDFESNVYESQI